MFNIKNFRCIIGWLGMLLPIIVFALYFIDNGTYPDSISATYFNARCITPFMGILSTASLFLFAYDGYNKIDDIINTAAALCGLGICLFPCAATSAPYIGTFQLPALTSNTIHMITAIGFFGILAYNSLFLFTRGEADPTPNKKKRNIIFRICGIGMIASFVFMVPVMMLGIYGGVWAIETVALFFFGVSWLTKANCYRWLFADPK